LPERKLSLEQSLKSASTLVYIKIPIGKSGE
jgi:hypothetical protein